MQKGLNSFSFLCTDISGSPVTSITSGGFSLFGSVGATNITSYTSSISEETSGFYTLQIDLSEIGQGYFGVKPVSNNVYVAPDFWDVTIENYDFDSLYALFLSLQQEGTVQEVNNFVEVVTNEYKESDDITLAYLVDTSITPNLTGWTNFKAQLRNSDSLTTSGSSTYIGDGVVTVVDALTNSVTIDISGSLTTGKVPEGSYTTNVYMDLQGLNPSGKKKTLIEFTIPIVREITYGN